MAGCRRRRGRRPSARLWTLLVVPVTLLALFLTLQRFPSQGNSTALPNGPATRAAMEVLNTAFTTELLQALASTPQCTPTLLPPTEDGVLIHWREIIAVSTAGDLPLEAAFAHMVSIVQLSVAEDGTALELLPAADGTLNNTVKAVGLQVQVICTSAESAAKELGFQFAQRRTLAQLLDHPMDKAWGTLFSGGITEEGVALCAALPKDLSTTRRAFVEAACGLLGQVNYFWGGKSDCVGWDLRWGTPALVIAPGIGESGTVMPYGMDCSGLVSWAAVTATGKEGAYLAAGDGVRAQFSACDPVEWGDAQPGDLLFFPDLSHVGIVAGRNEDGTLAAIHCSHSKGGVVLSIDAATTGFTDVGRPQLYAAYP